MSASSPNTTKHTDNDDQEVMSNDADKVVEITVDDEKNTTDAPVSNEDTSASDVDANASTAVGDGTALDDVPCDSEGDGQECAKPPEPKVTITSPSPDVVIATLEDPEMPSSEGDASEDDASTPADAAYDDMTNPPEQSADTAGTLDNTADQQTLSRQAAEPQAQADNTDANAANNEAATNDTTDEPAEETIEPVVTDEEVADTQSTSTTTVEETPVEAAINEEGLSEEEVIKEEKEAKLESYKQFVAEQFSDKKIDYPEVRVSIEANALPSKMYFVMNTLSAIIASYGLVTNSAAVVIGAMLVAMMLGPITGAALAVIDYRMPLLRKSLLTVLAGISLVIIVGFVVGLLHQGQPLTNEILSRTQPTSMDLMIALAGGTAGAYAMVSPHLSVAVVGVAVATALVPPLAASGILFANGEMQLGAGALLLAITNIIAIQFTNAMVLWFLGFRRLVEDDYKSGTYLTFLRRNAVTLLLLVGLGVYLTLNLQSNAEQQAFENQVKEAINQHFDSQGNVLTNTQFNKVGGHQVIRAVIRGETIPSATDVREIEQVITKNMNEKFPGYLPVKLQLRYLPVQVIESDPQGDDQLDETDAAILSTNN
ncbi:MULTISPECIES: DUF389 domain-containing protein [unclassified Psychrobacter]|uniref:DUF389 domain-containing protein n=1 Tax=unclassified Psychrobacter TaxID=196806 RepID=UPI001D196597|nr:MULTISPECIES: DUF389 domain-containing protein [unclassified Psychrobacter]